MSLLKTATQSLREWFAGPRRPGPRGTHLQVEHLEERALLSGDTLHTALVPDVLLGPGVILRTSQYLGDGEHRELDVDIIRIDAEAGSLLLASTMAPPEGSTLDPLLRLFDEYGREVAMNDNNFGNGLQAVINYTVPTTGTYFLAVSGSGNSRYNPNVAGSGIAASTGSYVLDVAVFGIQPPPWWFDVGDTLNTALDTGLECGGTACYVESISTPRDVDMYGFYATAGTVLWAETSLPNGGTPMDTYLRVFDAWGNELTADDDHGDGLYSLICDYTIPYDGYFYVAVSGWPNTAYNPFVSGSGVSGSTGDYRLDIQLCPTFVLIDIPAWAEIPQLPGPGPGPWNPRL